MLETLSGATRLIPIVGDPIAQVKSPYGMTAAFEQRGANLLCFPAHIAMADFSHFIGTMRKMRNVDGFIVTIPHKFSAFYHCETVSTRAAFLRSVNTIRRQSDGSLHGDMFDGLGFVAACKEAGCLFEGRKVLLIGAGGAGTAIAHGVMCEGPAELGIVDSDEARRDTLIIKLHTAGFSAHPAQPDAGGYDVLLNATPLGMRPGDPTPVSLTSLNAKMFVGDVVTRPEITPLIKEARRIGCKTSTGAQMFAKVRDLMIDFLLGDQAHTSVETG